MFPLTKPQTLLLAGIFDTSVTAQGINIFDSGTAAASTGNSGACIPSCTVEVSGVEGCENGSVDWSDNCLGNYNNPKGTQDVGDCSGVKMSWGRSQVDGKTVEITITKASDSTYNAFAVTNCKTASEGGSQCAPNGGGCDSTAVFARKRSAKFAAYPL